MTPRGTRVAEITTRIVRVIEVPRSQLGEFIKTPEAQQVDALRHMGYRSSNRYIVFEVLPHTLGLGPEAWRVLDKCHNTRNLGEYEGMLDVDARLVEDLVSATTAVAKAIQK
ncbi:MAG: hypothetical protein RL211_1222 [Pseudomonadota bacterium]